VPPKKQLKSPRNGCWNLLWPVWGLCAGLLLLVAIGIVQVYVASLPNKSDVPLVVLDHDRDIRLDPAKLRLSEVHLFETSVSGEKIQFVVERTQSNTIHVAIASCRLCYRGHNNNYVRKGKMICSECNGSMPFEVNDRNPFKNACALVEVPHTETNREVTVLPRDGLAQITKTIQR
jgi:hypothetical protein